MATDTTEGSRPASAQRARRRGRRASRALEARLLQLLHDVFQLDQLRPGQEAVIRSVLSGRHTIAVMPTGAGKSLCYQLPGLLLPGMTLVVSPLISVMKDQHDKLRRLGIPVAQVNSSPAAEEAGSARRAVAGRRSAFTFVTPEQLALPAFMDTVGRQAIALFVVDEAHCVSRRGHDFRPAYLGLRPAIERLGSPPVLALTAAGEPPVIEDMVTALGLADPAVLNTGLYRPNLRFSVRHVASDEAKLRAVVDIIQRAEGPGIVYAATVPHVELVQRVLEAEGCAVVRSHGRLPARERKASLERFMAGGARTIVATDTSGLGLDKLDLRSVVHYDIPGSLEAYYQEAARAGRDGADASCVLLFQRSDRSVQSFLMAGRYPREDSIGAIVRALRHLEARTGRVSFTDVQATARDVPRHTLRTVLAGMKAAGLVGDRRRAGLRLTSAATDEALDAIRLGYERRAERDRDRLEQMVVYGQSARCRWRFILDYFGEAPDWERCGTCDTCTGSAERPWAEAP